MNLKKLLFNKVVKTKVSKKIRNILNIKPSFDIINYNSKNISVSDAFFWRTDNDFKTIFRFSNILKFYYGKEDKDIEIIFFDKNNNFLKKETLNAGYINEILIDKNYFNNLEDYGVFYVFHKSKHYFDGIIRNSCYTGYSYKKSLPSFVHGNTIAAEFNYNLGKIEYNLSGFSFLKKNTYIVQNQFDNKRTEIMLINTTKVSLSILINEIKYKLNSGNSIIVDIGKKKQIEIESNCYLLRPIVFCYDDEFLDVHHG